MERDERFETLSDDAPVMIWVTGVDGGITWVNRRWIEFTGRPLEEHLGDGWAEDVHPDDIALAVKGYREAFSAREPYEAEVRLRRADGRYRWMINRAAPRFGRNGEFGGYVGACTDISDRRATESLLQLLADVGESVTASLDLDTMLNRIAQHVVTSFADLCTIAVIEGDTRIRRAGIGHVDGAEERALRHLDATESLTVDDGSALAQVIRTEAVLYRPLVDAPGPDEPWPPRPRARSKNDGVAERTRSLIAAPLFARGRVLGACVTVSYSRQYTPEDIRVVQEVARRCAAAVDNARLYRESEDARQRLALLAGLGEQLAGTFEPAEVTNRALHRVVPLVADCAIVALADERDVFRVVDVIHADAGRERAFRSEYVSQVVDADSQAPLARAIRERDVVMIEAVPYDSRHRRNDDALERARALGVTSLLSVPLQMNGTVIGAILLGYTDTGRVYSSSDVPLARDIARRVTLAVERTRTYVAERRIAETLQRSLLPDEMPELPNVALRARYVPGGLAEVGGDWYDVVSLSGNRLGVVIGDVAGHGVHAAAVMGQLRNALRAFAGEGYAPAAMVERLNDFVFSNGPSDMATLVYAALDPNDGLVRAVTAGHPPPLLLRADGTTEWLSGVGGPPIGADPKFKYRSFDAVLAPGDAMVMYTDGLIERRGESLDVGLDRLEAAAGALPPGAPLDDVCDGLTGRLLGGNHAEDDVAIIAVRFAGATPGVIRWRRPARLSELSTMRRVLAAWLVNAGMPREDASLIGVAVSEAMTNAVEHAYGNREGWVEVEARREADGVVVVVRDGGRWRPKAPGGGGRGLGLIGRLMDEFELRRADQGTEVWMRRTARGRTRT